ncbi:acyl-CoA dehydrogenase family protein [Nocardia fusca]|uniref:acyl-CoA dehydrogenase family protein n=1 Tax=Nocardia fusca TaxID=941183 RepID=UPI0037A9C0F0
MRAASTTAGEKVIDQLEKSLGLPFGDDERAFLAEMSEWLDEHVPSERAPRRGSAERLPWLRRWQATLAEGRYVAPAWPSQYGGRDATFLQQMIYFAELDRRRLPTIPGRIGVSLLGPTLIEHGTDEQRERYLGRLRRGDDLWCQGFSEPGAGSDLASLRTRGVIDGDNLVINGQKIWTSTAMNCDGVFALVRTDPDAHKRKGISFVLVPLDAPGVDVRPIRQISGDAEFCEVFFNDVTVPLGNVIGSLNGGWDVTRTTLANERAVLFLSRQLALSGTVDRLAGMARCVPHRAGTRADLPAVRERLAKAWIDVQLIRVNGMRNLAKVMDGATPGPEGSMSKLFGQEAEQHLHELAVDLAGPVGLLAPGSDAAIDDGRWTTGWLRTRASTIGGGTSEIQRNILAERVLGMPRDPWADEGV